MQDIVINVCEKFHNDRLRNDRALGNRKSTSNKKNKVHSAWKPDSGSNNEFIHENLNNRQVCIASFSHFLLLLLS